MPELGTYGSLGGMARESCLYPELDVPKRHFFVYVAGSMLHKKMPLSFDRQVCLDNWIPQAPSII
jgi:hypothetical protein